MTVAEEVDWTEYGELTGEEVIDLWAVRIVVREGRFMPLTRSEQIVAAHLMRKKGLSIAEASERLRLSPALTQKLGLRKPPAALDQVGDDVIGNPVIPPVVFPISIVRNRKR